MHLSVLFWHIHAYIPGGFQYFSVFRIFQPLTAKDNPENKYILSGDENLAQKHLGKQTIAFNNPPAIVGNACTVGKKEGEGPLKNSFDLINEDSFFGEKTWEKAESTMVKGTVALALSKASLSMGDIDYLFAEKRNI